MQKAFLHVSSPLMARGITGGGDDQIAKNADFHLPVLNSVHERFIVIDIL